MAEANMMFAGETIVAIYDDFENANAVLQALLDEGFLQSDVGLAVSDSHGVLHNLDFRLSHFDPNYGEQTGFAALLSNFAGTNCGLTPMVIPEMGSIIAAGPLADLLGSTSDTATGGISASLEHLGIPYYEAGYYAEALALGHALITVHIRTEEAMSMALDRLSHNHPIILNNRTHHWMGLDSSTDFALADALDEQENALSKPDTIGRFPYVRLTLS
jgi:hypothetical protein